MMTAPAPATTLDTTTPFTRTEAYAGGLTDHDLRDPRFVRIFRGCFVDRATTRTLAVRAAAALRIAPPSAVVSHHTAALLWGGAVPPQSSVHLTVPVGQDCRVRGITTHRFVDVGAPTFRRGLRLTTPERTVCDLARYLDLVDLVVLGDRLVRRQVTTPLKLVRAADTWSGSHQFVLSRAMRLVRAGVDSPPESRLRMLIVLAGLPEPTVNHIVRRTDNGDWIRRFELAYVDLLLAIEYQGQWHRESDDVWEADIERREQLDHRTWRVVEVIKKTMNEDPLRVLRRIEAARQDRGVRATPVLGEEWRAYFPATPAAPSAPRQLRNW